LTNPVSGKKAFITRMGLFFPIAVLLMAVVYVFYGMNVMWWANTADYGWRTMYDSGPNTVTELFPRGEAAGLRVGDRVTAINGHEYDTFDELYFKVRSNEPGETNSYSVKRDNSTLTIQIENGRLGLASVLRRSGPLLFIGLLYALIGVLVYLMKPGALESRVFLIMTAILGTSLAYASPSGLMKPLWLFDIRLFVEVMLPAPLIHLAIVFPKRREVLIGRRWTWLAPYVIALGIFLLFKFTAPAYWSTPNWLLVVNDLYLLIAILTFIALTIWNVLREKSHVERLQSQMILIGILLSFLIPVFELLLRKLGGIYLFPDPAVGFALFLGVFPLSIGYSIVKHDLFAIDTIVRRTYGYILSTSAIIGIYGTVVSILNLVFRSTDFVQSPVFSLVFALSVVFTFRPLHERIQGFVDRVFYRQKYDYRKTIMEVSDSLMRIFDAREIRQTLLRSVVGEMFLENGLVLLHSGESGALKVSEVEGEISAYSEHTGIPGQSPLMEILKDREDILFRHELSLDPSLQPVEGEVTRELDNLEADLVIPIMYKDELAEVISLGRKKSGKMFNKQDADLLRTIANQGTVALENARLFEENLEKGRMEEELKIAHELQTSMLPEGAPELPGFKVAAWSVSAREVGGDFYDFIPIEETTEGQKLGIVIGDVSGKAVSGALVMAAARSIFRILSSEKPTVQEVMNASNKRLKHDIKKGMFVALLYAVIDPVIKTVTLANAGQTQPVLLRKDHLKTSFVETDGDKFPLGIVESCTYLETTVQLRSGDTILFYTDGVVEAMNPDGDMYGFERLQALLERYSRSGAQELLDAIRDDVTHFAGEAEQHDDITVVAVTVD
jgi:serine phosphatase RsbU (regulator of sigma subunit)